MTLSSFTWQFLASVHPRHVKRVLQRDAKILDLGDGIGSTEPKIGIAQDTLRQPDRRTADSLRELGRIPSGDAGFVDVTVSQRHVGWKTPSRESALETTNYVRGRI